MAAGWVKSLQCKTRAFDDVRHPDPTPSPKTLISSSSCRKSVQSIKDVIDSASAEMRKRPSKNTKPGQANPRSSSGSLTSVSDLGDPTQILRVIPSDSILLPTLAELGEAHPSRKVVEIIFKTSWSPGNSTETASFSGKVEMVFKVQNPGRTVARFEEYREVIKSRSGSGCDEHGRCSADGNELLRFHCLGPTAVGTVRLVFPGGKAKAVCTFTGSGRAHESGGGGSGRKGMMVCRVIAGRVGKKFEEGIDTGGFSFGFGFDSISGSGGELVVLDPRAVLPCFLIIYKV
ncbi:hypothetical protein QQ045_020950 [Rhodiola kirilowii]